jgi:penicillin amidase
MSGSVPRHAEGEGLLPRDGASAVGEPPEPLPPNEMPHLLDPPSGVLVTANNAPGVARELGEDWCESARADRIVAMLAMRSKHDIGSFAAMQQDTRSEALVRVRSVLLTIDALKDLELRSLLTTWDGKVDIGSGAAALLELVVREAAQAISTRLAGSDGPTLLGVGLGAPFAGSSFGFRAQGWVVRAIEATGQPYWDDAAERDRVVRAATERAVATLQRKLGPQPAKWRWGALHRWRAPHALDAVPGLRRWFSRGPYPFPGDVNTVLQGASPISRDSDRVGMLPGYRQVIDLADMDRSVFILSTGNSGIPGHEHYGDCIDEYLRGQYRPLLFSRPAVEAQTAHALTLQPA